MRSGVLVFAVTPVFPVVSGPPPEPAPTAWASRDVIVDVDSGPVANGGVTLALVFASDVTVSGATWVRLRFDEVTLSGDVETRDGSFLVVTSVADGAEQVLDSEALRQWGNTTAYFNGDTVTVQLYATPGTGESRVRLGRVTVGEMSGVAATVCGGTDERALGSRPSAARLAGGCSAWLIDDQFNCLLGAGHCANGMVSDVVQFNVPISDNEGALNHPSPDHQYAIDPVSMQFANGGLGNDWAYFGCYPNPNTGLTPVQMQQDFYVLGPVPEGPGDPLRINGYGVATPQIPPSWNRVQKTATGPLLEVASTSVAYEVDTLGGDSGSPVLDEALGMAIAIHTHGACHPSGGANHGTRLDSPELQAALASPQGVCGGAPPPPGFVPPLLIGADLNLLHGGLDRGSGVFSPFSYTDRAWNGMAYDRDAGVFYATTAGPEPKLLSIDEDDLFIPSGETQIGVIPLVDDVHGLAFDHATGVLYGINQGDGQLYQIDTETASAVPLGVAAGGNVGGLAFDVAAGVLYGVDDSDDGTQLVSIDPITGVHTTIGALGIDITDCDGLAWCEDDGGLYTLDAVTGQTLFVDAVSGAASAIGVSNASFGSIYGLACGRDPCFADTNADQVIGVLDLIAVILSWGQADVPADVNEDGVVDVGDLVEIIVNWGPCP